jgi:hypothetical protein
VSDALELSERTWPHHESANTAKLHRKPVRERQGISYDQGRARQIAEETIRRAAVKNIPPDMKRCWDPPGGVLRRSDSTGDTGAVRGADALSDSRPLPVHTREETQRDRVRPRRGDHGRRRTRWSWMVRR